MQLVIVPGLRGHVEDHWQTHLARAVPAALTLPPVEDAPWSLSRRTAALAQMLAGATKPVVLVAHSAGVLITAHWALRAGEQELQRIQGALLATPPDLECALPEGYPQPSDLEANGWFPLPMQRLPFRSTVVLSQNDPLATSERVSLFANIWGSAVFDAGPVGHLNPASGFGAWPVALDLIRGLV